MEEGTLQVDVPDKLIKLFSRSISLPGFEVLADHEIKRCFSVEDVQRLMRRNTKRNTTIAIERRQSLEGFGEFEPIIYCFNISDIDVQFYSSFAEYIPTRIVGEYNINAQDETLLRRLTPFGLGSRH